MVTTSGRDLPYYSQTHKATNYRVSHMHTALQQRNDHVCELICTLNSRITAVTLWVKNLPSDIDVLLTVHLSIILAINQLNAQNLLL